MLIHVQPQTRSVPGTVRHGTVHANGADLYYELCGSGPAALFISGAIGDAGDWTQVADPLQSTSDTTLWRAVAIWKSREGLEEYRRSVKTPGGVLLFRGVGAEPTLFILEVAAHAPKDSPR
jgi:hypothetical protein